MFNHIVTRSHRRLSPLAANTGLDSGDIVNLVRNPLDTASKSTEIPALRARGVTVAFDEFSAITEPQIHNDNVLVPQVTTDLATLWTQLCAPTGAAFQGRLQGVVDRRCAVNCPSIPIRLKVNNTRILTCLDGSGVRRRCRRRETGA